jgi:acyl-CoA hydrolase
MEVGIKVVTEDIRQQTVRHANSCFFTMVALDDARQPAAVPPLAPVTPDQQRRFEAAKVRRQLREEFDARMRATHQQA